MFEADTRLLIEGLNVFGVLYQKFRLKPESRKFYFTAVAVITQLDIENGHPMAKVEYKIVHVNFATYLSFFSLQNTTGYS